MAHEGLTVCRARQYLILNQSVKALCTPLYWSIPGDRACNLKRQNLSSNSTKVKNLFETLHDKSPYFIPRHIQMTSFIPVIIEKRKKQDVIAYPYHIYVALLYSLFICYYSSRSLERILILVFLWYKVTNFLVFGATCNLRLAAPTDKKTKSRFNNCFIIHSKYF